MNLTKGIISLSQLSGTLKFIIKTKRRKIIETFKSSTASFGDLLLN